MCVCVWCVWCVCLCVSERERVCVWWCVLPLCSGFKEQIMMNRTRSQSTEEDLLK